MRSYNPVPRATPGQIKKAVQLLLEAKRPMVYTGGGVILSDASGQLRELVRLLGFPCTNTLMGLGALSRRPTRSSSACSACTARTRPTWRCSTATCCSPIGARFDDRVIGNPAHFAAEPAQDHPHRHRPVVDLQAREGRRADRRRRRRRARGCAQDSSNRRQRARPSDAEGVVEADRGVAAQGLPAGTTARPRSSSRSSCSRSSTRSPRATRSSRPTSASTRCGRRSTTSSTSRGAGSTRAASARWASACRRRWACRWSIRARRWRASPARRRSRCASRSSRPASSTACRSRS